MSTTPLPRSVLITGCSTGIGLAAAERMRNAGWTVIPTARKEADLERLRATGFTPVFLDVTSSDSIRQAVEESLKLCGGQIGALVNNAGFGQPGALEDLDRDAMRYQFEVNVNGLLELTNTLLPHLIERGSGRVVHVSSVVGRTSIPFMGIYSASKFAVEAIADAQRVEWVNTGVTVHVLEPGPIETAFRKTSMDFNIPNLENSRFTALYKQELQARKDRGGTSANPLTLPPDAAAKKIQHALEARYPKRRYKVTIPAYFGAFASRFFPDFIIDYLLSAQLRRVAKKT